MTRRVQDVTLDPKSAGRRAQFTYLFDGVAEVGDAVLVPVGRRSVLGYVTREYDATEEELGFSFSDLKPIADVVRGVRLPPKLLRLAERLAEVTQSTFPIALSVCVPPGVRDRLETALVLGPNQPGANPVHQEVYHLVHDSEDQAVPESQVERFSEPLKRAVKQLCLEGVLQRRYRLIPFMERRRTEKFLRLIPDETRIEQFLHREGKRRPAQAITLITLQSAGNPALTPAEIRAMSGVTDSTVRALLQEGLLESIDPESPELVAAPTPNAAQSIAIEAITDAITSRRAEPFLLFGVTGSGKTEVYLRAAAAALAAGRQVLYLVPEIALATQAITQVRSRFGRGVAVLHSELTVLERLRAWSQIAAGEVGLVIGPRSALFAPLTNLGLIVMDEEHEGAYKQDQSPRYHARTLARELSELHDCPVVLGSATPSFESFAAAERGEITLASLPSRTATARLPEITICDLTQTYRSGKPSLLVPELSDAIREALHSNAQVILFLNRRAYSPFVICRDCGHRPNCPHCSVSLSYHRSARKVRCHQCGFSASEPVLCPSCQGTRLKPLGIGTEKVEEVLAVEFPEAKIGRLDRDVATQKGAIESVLSSFRSGDLNILIGTQMVAKGLDFPRVTVVGVIAADISLSIPDFRSGERTFQLLSQVSGRAGRGELPGRVFIQTFSPDHPAVDFVQRHDFVGFFQHSIKEREMLRYPPYSHLVNLIVTSVTKESAVAKSEEIAAALRGFGTVLGPADCPIEKLNNRYRRHLLVKLDSFLEVEQVGQVVSRIEPGKCSIVVDVDPVNFS